MCEKTLYAIYRGATAIGIQDARKVLDNLATRPFITHQNHIELDNGYVIMKKEYFEKLIKAAGQNDTM